MLDSNNKNKIFLKLRTHIMKRQGRVYFGTDHDDQRSGEISKIA